MIFAFPGIGFKKAAREFFKEFYDSNSDFNGVGSPLEYIEEDNYYEWLRMISLSSLSTDEEDIQSYTYFCLRDEDRKLVGMLNMRLSMSEKMTNEIGNIGYCVRPTMRGNGYATQILSEAVEMTTMMNIDKIIIVCDKDNAASRAVIEKCGGEYVSEAYSTRYKRVIQKYCIRMGKNV